MVEDPEERTSYMARFQPASACSSGNTVAIVPIPDGDRSTRVLANTATCLSARIICTHITAHRTCILYGLVSRHSVHDAGCGCNEDSTKDAHLEVGGSQEMTI